MIIEEPFTLQTWQMSFARMVKLLIDVIVRQWLLVEGDCILSDHLAVKEHIVNFYETLFQEE